MTMTDQARGTPALPAEFLDIMIESLTSQIANDARQREILVEWMADIDERTFRNETELDNHRRARGPQ
jgi:hypothetical protein